MSGPEPTPRRDVPDDEVPDLADERMAEVLRETKSSADLRRELQDDDSAVATDLMARLDALEFVQSVVGAVTDVPQRLGDYHIKGLLGRGGMGTVYLGWQEELEREVALKVLAPHFSADPTMRKRFRAEARATAALHHRHIVPIYDYGEAQGVLFFAMERVDGISLDKHIAAARRMKKPPLDPLVAARRFAGVADALGLAHRRRLLHRDVKPGNILVAADGTMALTDFGLAKALDQASAHLTSKGGAFLGTLHYASPEQALGRELTPASDLYSLGVTIFEAVTGELPLAGKTTEAMLHEILHGTPKRLRDHLPKPPRDLEIVLEKLLSREPGDRYQDGEALSRDLQRIADGEPVHVRRLPLHVRVYRRAKKNPVLAGAIAAAVVLLLLTVTLLNVWRREAGRGLVARHQYALVDIANKIGAEAGPACGPAPLLFALCGARDSAEAASPNILAALKRAHDELPDDPEVETMRVAYENDPLPAASAFLRDGRGYEALRLYDQAIAEAIGKRTSGELAVELRLYRLYLGRAIANLTAAVARPTDARSDLTLAMFLRPGAVFPNALLHALDTTMSSRDGVVATQQLENDLRGASPERLRTVGLLLWGIAGLRPVRDANVMDFGMPFAKRRALHDLAQKLLRDAPGQLAAVGESTGLARQLEDRARDAMKRLGEPAVLTGIVDAARTFVDTTVHPESPLQCWRAVLQLLQPAQKGALLDADGRAFAPTVQLAAWEALVRLVPAREQMIAWRPRFEELRRDHPNLPGLVRVAAQVHGLAQTDEAPELASTWLVDTDEPAARLWRMRARLRAGETREASDDAIIAVQASPCREDAIAEVVRICEQTAATLPSGLREGVQLIRQQFAELLVGEPREVRR